MFDLQAYLSNNISNMMLTGYKNMLRNPREARFMLKMQQTFKKSERLRQQTAETEGFQVPPFLISSISNSCNLQCKGCYARKNGIADNPGASTRATLTADQWKEIFEEAASIGINFSLLVGGEPMMRRDILEKVAEVKDMIFPVFTNGTLISPVTIDFFRKNLNMVPVISLEGDMLQTDSRRGKGVYERVLRSMSMLQEDDIFFGVSITVTSENLHHVTSDDFVGNLNQLGCKLIFYVEYVPIEDDTAHLALSEQQLEEQDHINDHLRELFSGIIFLSFPGDEKYMEGCLAAGRGFFHIGPDGAAEPCPFSPFSDSNVVTLGLKGALKSPLFRKLRDVRLVGGEMGGGCTLYEHRHEVEQLLRQA
jgi:MoaA/NifB/PqqE/SkfB family radical SAM enzyme